MIDTPGFPAKTVVTSRFVDPDAIPAIGNLDSDEFEASTVSGVWNTSKLLGSTTSIVNGNLELVSGVPGADANRVRFLYKALDRSDTAYVIRVQSLDTGGTNASSGFVLWDSVGGRYEIFQVGMQNGVGMLFQGYTAAGGFGTNYINTAITANLITFMYLKLVFRNNMIFGYYSYDGYYWIFAHAHSHTAWLANAPDNIGLGTCTFSGSGTTARIYFFRKFSPFYTAQ